MFFFFFNLNFHSLVFLLFFLFQFKYSFFSISFICFFMCFLNFIYFLISVCYFQCTDRLLSSLFMFSLCCMVMIAVMTTAQTTEHFLLIKTVEFLFAFNFLFPLLFTVMINEFSKFVDGRPSINQKLKFEIKTIVQRLHVPSIESNGQSCQNNRK